MIPLHELFLFALAAFILVISPGPNMIYLISRSLTQGRKAGLISLLGLVGGFLFHILMVSFGLTAVLLTVPFLFTVLKALGVIYLLYLAFNAITPNGQNIFDPKKELRPDKPAKLFTMGLLTNVLNPKMGVFYLSFFPQFIRPAHGSVLMQCLQLGIVQMTISFTVNFIIILSAAKAATWFARHPKWIRVQKWFMASVLTGLAIKMAVTKTK